jgi:unsaturated rhamnogalacturonyl hydrolase
MKKLIIALPLFLIVLISESIAQQKVVTLDYFYNSETKKNTDGAVIKYRYTWEDNDLRSYSLWGNIFRDKGMQTKNLETQATTKSLKKSDIYIISDPDNYKDNVSPNYMNNTDANEIAKWVKQGGVLVLLANDSANADLAHFNILSEKFGMHFTDLFLNAVKKDLSVGKIVAPDNHEIFKKGRVIYQKEICTIDLSKDAKSVLNIQDKSIMATSKYGKGTVIAICDPWIYNEYIVNDRLTNEFQNMVAAEEFTEWLIKQIPASKK